MKIDPSLIPTKFAVPMFFNLSRIYQKRTTYTPSWVKVKYGAWYLNPKTWKKQKDGEPLEDPKQQQENALSEAKAETENLVRIYDVRFYTKHNYRL